MLDTNGSKPMYGQRAEWIEKESKAGALSANEKVHSQYQLADLFNINPATAGKGLTLLLDEEVVYQRRGLGTFVSPTGREKLLVKRKDETLRPLITKLLEEAMLLGVDDQNLQAMIETERKRKKGVSH